MADLQAGIRIFCAYQANRKEPQLWLSAGTIAAIDAVPDRDCYCAGSFVPQAPWREPTLAERTLLWADEPPPREIGIAIVQVPAAILTTFIAAGVGSAATVTDAKNRMREGCQAAIAQLVDFFAPFCLGDEPPVINGMGARETGLWTSTLDRQRGCRNGLHTDNWDKLAPDQKHQATNRICVNLGCEDRYFLFINLPESALLDRLGTSSSEALSKPWKREATQAFMRQQPDYPVVKLRIAPGEAYIAPTENMIHDATTLEKRQLDIKVMLRGQYQLYPSQASASTLEEATAKSQPSQSLVRDTN